MLLSQLATLYLPLAPTPTSVRTARWAIGNFLDEHGAGDLMPSASLLTSELVSNAVRYTGRPCGITARLAGSVHHLRVEVADLSTRVPALPPRPDPGTVGGFGLRIVDEVAASWGVERTWQGKKVWFELGSEREG
jgi:hypothetical protein